MTAANHARLFMVVLAAGLCFLLDCEKHRQVAAEFQFNAAGNLVATTGPDGKKTSLQYDSRGLPTAVVSPEGSVLYDYDAHGNRIWVRDDTGSTEYYYDAFDRLSAVIWNRGPRRLLAYQYDHTGLPSRISVFNLQPLQSVPKFSEQLARLTTPSEPNSTNWHEREMVVLNLADQLRNAAPVENASWLANDISYVRNLQGDLQEIRSEAGIVRFDRSADGSRVKRVLPNGIHSIFEYAPSGRISRLSHADSSGGEIASFTYNYDKAGRVQNVYGSEHGRPTKTEYVWDDHGRLQKMITDGVGFLYKYDVSAHCLSVVSDKKTVTYTFDPLGRLSKANGVALDVTPQRTISVLRDDSETTEIRYNDQYRPVEMITRGAKLRYVWDGEGNLVSLKRNGKAVYFVPAAGTGIQLPLIQFDGNGTPESKLLISNSILGEIHLGGTEFYLEGASGGACYLANGPTQRSNEFQRYVSLSREPGNLPALVPARFHVPRVRASIGSGSLMLAQCTACQQHQAADEGWNLQLAQAQGWLQGMGEEILANQDILDRDAQSNLRRGGAWGLGGLWGTVEAGESAVFYDLPSAALRFAAANVDYYSSPNQRNLSALNKTGFNLAIQLFMQLSVVGKGVEKFAEGSLKLVLPVLKPAISNRWFAQNLGILYKTEIQDPLDSLVTNGELQKVNKGIVTAAQAIANGRFADAWNTATSSPLVKAPGWWDTSGNIAATLDKIQALNKASHTSEPSSAKQVAGIQLASTVQGDIGTISGAVYDQSSGSIVLLTDSSDAAVSGLRAEDFAVALRLACSGSPEEAAFSLDPADPKNPKGPWLQKVYYPDGVLAGTEFGRAMFDADWLLKQYSFGVVVEPGKPQRIRMSAVAGYKSVADLAMANEHGDNRPATTSRFWIVSGEMKIRRYGSAIIFDRASMGVKTKRLIVNPNSKTGLSDDDSVKDPIHEEFARRFTEHYDELAAESPELERVRELAKAVAIAKWLRQNDVPVDLNGMNPGVIAVQTADPDAHQLVPALSTTFKKVTQTPIHSDNQEGVLTSTTELYLFGGVDLKSSPDYIQDSSVGELQRTVQQKLKQIDSPRFEVAIRGQHWTGTVLPLTRQALVESANARTFVRNGNTYRVDSEGRLVEMVDKLGDQAHYRDPAKGLAGGVEITGTGGWHAVAQPLTNGTSLQMTTARGNEIEVISDSASGMGSITVDGKAWAEYRKQGTGGSLRIDQGSYSEVLTFDGAGRTTGYQLERPSGPGKTETESATMEYSAEGLPTRLSGTGLPDTQWQYDSTGRLQRVWSSNGSSVTVTYDDGGARTILEGRAGAVEGDSPEQDMAKLVFENHRLVSSESSETGNVEFKYDNQRLLAINAERLGKTSFSYDKYGRPALVSLASGASFRYRFADKSKPGAFGNVDFRIQVLERRP